MKATATDFKQWSVPGLRGKYLELLKLPKWKKRSGQIEDMDHFGQLQVICQAQLSVAHSRLQRKEDKQDTKAQELRIGILRTTGFAANDNNTDDTTLESSARDGVVDSEIKGHPPLQKPQDSGYVRSGKYVGKNREKVTPHVSEEKTTEGQKANVNGMEQNMTNECDAARNTKNLSKAVPEIHETPPPMVASTVGVSEVIVIDSSDDD
ncbi:hypothetical protein N0V82_009600 [Gnomoniopsis sp. IMI 355080]|nr:hypothetical protein N0V82_009600 [Gnomoniopsis sp. IMI 355080]